MSQILYAKYNSLRKPEYQIATKIIRDNDTKMVVKLPSFDVAKKHIETIKANYKILQGYYKDIRVIPFSGYRNGLAFVYIKGRSLIEDIDFAKDDIESITKALSSIMDRIFDIREEYITSFEMTQQFRDAFPECEVKEGVEAYTVSNLDSIFSNFLDTDMGLVCLDYEWVLDFPVPSGFIKYRALAYLYNDVASYMSSRIEINEFLKGFGLSEEDIELYKKMDDIFQTKIHGENRKYSYLRRYEKDARSAGELLNSERESERLVLAKQQHIENLNGVVEILRKDVSTLQSEEAELNKKVEEQKELIERQQQELQENEEKMSEQQTLLTERYELIKTQEADIHRIIDDVADRDRKILLLSQKTRILKRSLFIPFYGIYALVKYVPEIIRLDKEEEQLRLEKERLLEEEKQRIEEEKRKKEAEEKREEYRFKALLDEAEGNYESWIEKQEAGYDFSETLDYRPLISVVVPVYNVPDDYLLPCIESVKNQIYDNWELILVDDCSDYEEYGNIRETLDNYKGLNRLKNIITRKSPDSKIRAIYRKENGRISACTNTGIKAARGEYIAFMDCDDTLAPFALYEVVRLLNKNPELDFIYSDEDKINDDGTERHTAFFKPDWSPDTLMSYMYTSHLGVYRTKIVRELGGLNSDYDGCQDYDLTLRFTEKTDKVGHVPKVLYHWRERVGSTALNPEAKDYVKAATKKCKEAALERRNLSGVVEWIDDIYQYRVRYIPKDEPLVSIIIPSKDNPKILEQCLKSLVRKTNYRNYEIVVVDNGSGENNKIKYQKLLELAKAEYIENNTSGAEELAVQYIYEKKKFNFSYMCNTGAASAKGDYFLFLNDDIEIIDEQWLDRMLGQAELPSTGAVGAKLLYPDTTLIQHAGVLSIESGPVHEFAKMDDSVSYYFNHNRLDFDVLAVTAACLLIRKKVFEEVGGFDENLAVAYNDIDFCFKLVEKGYFNVIRNDVVLYHHESISRGDDTMDRGKFKRLMAEQKKLYEKHPQFKRKDPFYNENLIQVECDYSYNYEIDKDYSVAETDPSQYPVDEMIRYGVDVTRTDWCIYIEGWALRLASSQNLFINTQVLLIGDDVSYIINTAHVRREDVVKIFNLETGITFSGYKLRVDKGMIKDGHYEIRVVCDGNVADIENRNINSIETIDIY